MVLVWNSYISDLGRSYPMASVIVTQLNDVPTEIDALDLLPSFVLDNLVDVRNSCSISGLTFRFLVLWLSDGSQWSISYPMPFNLGLANYLNNSVRVRAWEMVGEKIKYGRLRKLLDNV